MYTKQLVTVILALIANVMSKSLITKHKVFNRNIFVHRDDLNCLIGNKISGNKSRKLLFLTDYLKKENCNFIFSYGGAQSNAMVLKSVNN